jgi:hemerythrin superfamily protein
LRRFARRADRATLGQLVRKENTMAQQDAIALLDADHMHVEQLFAEYQTADHGDLKREVAHRICDELSVHAQIEEEIFYPAVRRATGDDRMVDDAEKEHNDVRELINVIEAGPYDDATMTKLQRLVEHHVKEEREEMFDHARRTPGLDLMKLGEQLEHRKSELMAHAP